jgi:hypothetical protein
MIDPVIKSPLGHKQKYTTRPLHVRSTPAISTGRRNTRVKSLCRRFEAKLIERRIAAAPEGASNAVQPAAGLFSLVEITQP